MTIEQRPSTADPVTRVEFSLSNDDFPFVRASTLDGCEVSLQEMIPRGDGAYAEFFTLSGLDPDRIAALAADFADADARVLNRYEDGGLVEVLVGDSCPAVALGELGALPRNAFAVDGEGRLTAEIPADVGVRSVVGEFLDAYPGTELMSKRSQPNVTPMFGRQQYQETIAESLTERQREVVAVAHETGYYEWPRQITADGVAEALDVSAPTAHKHLRAAERKLIAAFFDDAK